MWQRFKSRKISYYSFLIFMTLFIISLFAELIANDKPILIKYNDAFYFPFIKKYPEYEFAKKNESKDLYFETEADYKDKYIKQNIEENGYILWPIINFSYDTIDYNSGSLKSPNKQNILGTDDEGRDVLARVIYGFRISILFGLTLTILSSIIGISAGAIQGYFGGIIDLIFQRFIEIWSSLPQLFILIIIASIITPNFWWLLLITLLFSWMGLTGVVRAECLRNRKQEYVKAAKALGLSDFKILFKHILPNSLVASFAQLPFIICGSVVVLTSLDFLGFGLPPGSPSLGELLSQGKSNLSAPWLGLTGFFTISIILTLLVFIGEGIRYAFDPRE